MPNRYISDENVTINTQGLRTVKREDSLNTPGHKWRLLWSYKGQEGFCMYTDQAARDAMYEALRKALTAKEQKQPWHNAAVQAARCAQISLDSFVQDAIEEHLRRSDGGRSWPIAESKQQKQMKGSYSRLEAAEAAHEFFARIRFDLSPQDAKALIEALEPIMRSGGSDAV